MRLPILDAGSCRTSSFRRGVDQSEHGRKLLGVYQEFRERFRNKGTVPERFRSGSVPKVPTLPELVPEPAGSRLGGGPAGVNARNQTDRSPGNGLNAERVIV